MASSSAGSRRRDLMGAAVVMIAAFVLSRATGLLRSIAISYQFGTGSELDAYLAANRVSDFVFQIVVGGAVASAFIPVLSGYLAREDRAGAWRLVSALFTLSLIALLPLCGLLWLRAEDAVALAAPGFPEEQRALAAELLRILLVGPLFFALGTFTTSVLNAEGRFLLAALAPSIYNLGIVCGALFLGGPFGVHGLALGTALGAGGFLLIQLPGLLRLGFRYQPRLGVRDPGVRRVGWLMLPRTFGLAITQVNFLVVLLLASPIPGAIAALEYAWTLAMLPLGIFAMAISTAVFPTLADQTARDQMEEMIDTLSSALRVILYLTIPASVGLAALAEPIVRLLLERGAFSEASTALTVHALRFYAIGLLGQAAVEIVTRAFYALQDTRTPVIVAGVAMAAHVVMSLLLRPWLGYGGMALSLSLTALGEAAALLLLARIRLGSIGERRLLPSAIRSFVGALALAATVGPTARLVESALGSAGPVERAAVALGPVALGAAVYVGVTAVLRAEEPRHMFGVLRRRLG